MSQSNDLSFASLLAGGVLILVGGLGMGTMMNYWGSGMMGGMMGYAPSATWLAGMAWWMIGVSLVTGILVLLAAYNIRNGRDSTLWGTLAIVAGALSLLAMGGWILGAAASILGGALALAHKPAAPPPA